MRLSLQSVAIAGGPFAEPEPAAPPPLDAAMAAAMVAHAPDLLRHARRLMPSSNDAQDLVQDTFERALRALHQFRPGSNLRAWLYTIMVSRARDHYRRARVRRRESCDLDTVAAPDPEPPPENPWLRVTEAQFRRAVEQLSPRLREVFELHEVQHLPYADVSLRLAIPVNTVGTRLSRAREKLRKLLMVELAGEVAAKLGGLRKGPGGGP